MDINILKKIIKDSNSRNEVFTKMNLNNSSGNYKYLNKLISDNKIDISHFRNRVEETLHLYSTGVLQSYENIELFVENSKISRGTVKKRLIRDKLINYECEKCGNKGEWEGKKLILILDHINGIRNDNRIENLRFLCPNCNSTLSTHCKGSKGLIEKIDKREKELTKKIKYIKSQEENINKVKTAKIDFSKIGWVTKVSKLIGISPQKSNKWVEKCLPDIYKNVYIRKSPRRR